MNKNQLKEKLKALLFRHQIEENNLEFYKSMTKKELKAFVNEHGGFTKGQIHDLSFDEQKEGASEVPAGAFRFEAILSDESVNMNGYRILLSAWQEGFENYFNDYEGLVYLQHDMDQPIGKTLDIAVDDNQEVLYARGYVYDDLTDKRISRGLVRDISTGHIPLEILYINKDTKEEKTPDEFFELMWDVVDRLWDENKERSEIKEVIIALQELWIETHTKVQIVEYSFVSVGSNRNAKIKTINNNAEKLNTEIPNDVSLERSPHDDQPHGGDDLKNDGETPEATTEDQGTENTENVSETHICLNCQELLQLNAILEQKLADCTAELDALKQHQNNRIVLIPRKKSSYTMNSPRTDQALQSSVAQLLS